LLTQEDIVQAGSSVRSPVGRQPLAHDLAPRGIAVVMLHPGSVRTGMTGGHGEIEAAVAVRGLLQRIDELTLETTGRFLHQNGQVLPW
jgi:NAD(P)-dependent dehydrogenase (short-subunit alcohol dehydrogenase family)